MENISKEIEAIGSDPKKFKDFAKLNTAVIENIASQFYNNEEYKKAESIFEFLCSLDGVKKSHWFGLGASAQMLNKYKKALPAYQFCGVLDLEDPQAPFHAAECLLAMGKKNDAVVALEASIACSKSKTAYKELRAKAKILLEKTQKEKN